MSYVFRHNIFSIFLTCRLSCVFGSFAPRRRLEAVSPDTEHAAVNRLAIQNDFDANLMFVRVECSYSCVCALATLRSSRGPSLLAYLAYHMNDASLLDLRGIR